MGDENIIEQKLDEIFELLPPVVGNGWSRAIDEEGGTVKVYILRVRKSELNK